MSLHQTSALIVHSLRQDTFFQSLAIDGSDHFAYEIIQLFDGTPIGSLPDFTMSPDPAEADKPPGDFLDYTSELLFSSLAVRHLKPMLLTHGQLFPVSTTAGQYFAYNVTTIVDALDREHSAMEMWPHLKREREAGIPQRVCSVKEYWFHADRLEGIDIFKLPEFPLTEVYVSDRFVRVVEQTLLTGFRFERLWSPADPMPDLRPRRLPG